MANWQERLRQAEIDKKSAEQDVAAAQEQKKREWEDNVQELAKVLDRLKVAQKLNEVNMELWGGEGVVNELAQTEPMSDRYGNIEYPQIQRMRVGSSLVYTYDYPVETKHKYYGSPKGTGQHGPGGSQVLVEWTMGKSSTSLSVFIESDRYDKSGGVKTRLVIMDSHFSHWGGQSGGESKRTLEFHSGWEATVRTSLDETELGNFIDVELLRSCIERTNMHNLPPDFRSNSQRLISSWPFLGAKRV